MTKSILSTRVRVSLALLVLTSLACQAVTTIGGGPAATATPVGDLAATLDALETEIASLSSPLTSTPTPEFTATTIPTSTMLPSASPSEIDLGVTVIPTATVTQTPVIRPLTTGSPLPTDAGQAGPRQIPKSSGQMQVFEQLWSVVNEEYLYPDFNGLDWDAVYDEYRARIEAGMRDEAFYLAMDEMIYRLGDDHSIFFSPDETLLQEAEFSGEYDYVGIGILNTVVLERELVTIILVFPGSPADQAGLQVHDSILAVDGEPIIDENGFRSQSLRGPEGSSLTLTIRSPGGEPRDVTLTRRRIAGEMPVPYQVLETGGDRRIGYLLLVTFNDITVVDQIEAALRAMSADAPLDGLIIDNRQNGGGADVVMAGTLSYFTEGVVGYFVNRQGQRPLPVAGKDIGGSQSLPLAVLVGPDTASFGEIFAGILQDRERAALIGEPTEGNVEILYVYDFEDGSSAWIAHDTFQPLNHPDSDWEGSGVIPDQVVPANWDEVVMESDPVIAAAVQMLAATP